MLETTKITATDWKFLAVIKANFIFESECFHHKDCLIKILKDNTSEIQKNELHRVEVYMKRANVPDIIIAYYKSIDLLNEFLDQLSFISFQPAIIANPIAITYFKAKIDEEFPMIHIHPSLQRKKIKLSSKDFKSYNSMAEEEQKYFKLLRILNYYQNSARLDDKFLYLYSVIDHIAEIETTEYQIKKCEKCENEIKLNNKATGNHIKKLVIESKLEEFDFNKVRSLRGKIAHGSKKRDYSFFSELSLYLPKLETLVYTLLVNRLPIPMKLTTNIHMLTSLLTLQCKCEEITDEIRKYRSESVNEEFCFRILDHKLDFEGAEFTNILQKSNDIFNDENNPNDFFDGSFGINYNDQYGNIPISVYAWPYFEKNV